MKKSSQRNKKKSIQQTNISRVVTIQSAVVDQPVTPKDKKPKIHNLTTLRKIIQDMKKDLLLDKKSHLEVLKERNSSVNPELSVPALQSYSKSKDKISESSSKHSKERIEEMFSKIRISKEAYSEIKDLLQNFEESNEIILHLQNENQNLIIENQRLNQDNISLEIKVSNCLKQITKLEEIDFSMRAYITDLEDKVESLINMNQEKDELLDYNKNIENDFKEEINERDNLIEELWNEIKKYRKNEKQLLLKIEKLEPSVNSSENSKKRNSSSKKQIKKKERKKFAKKILLQNLKEIENKGLEDIPLLPKLKQVIQ